MAREYRTISFLTDYGLADEFVGVVKAVLRAIAPDAHVIDITHDVPPHDVRAGSLTLARSVQYLNPGVVLAVVDPGVGTDRRALAVEVGDGESVLVGPDNGLLAPAVAMVGGASRAVTLTNDDFQLATPGVTFDGRDVFAPAAAHLCNGVDLLELGEEVDALSLRPGLLPITRAEGDSLVGEVLWVDRFGNAQLNVDPDEVEPMGERIRVRTGKFNRVAARVRTFAEVGPGDVGLIVDSYGLLSIALNRHSAADELRLEPGNEVTLEPVDEDDDGAPDDPGAVRIELRRS